MSNSIKKKLSAPLLFDLSDQVAFVTGAGSGIGQGIAIGLAEAGARVSCFDCREDDGLVEVQQALTRLKKKSVITVGDVTRRMDLEEAVARTEKELGMLTIAVNAAGIANAEAAEEMPLDQWQMMIDINLTGVFLSCQVESKSMIENGYGSIVNIASMSGEIVNRGLSQSHYNASKAGVIHLSKSMAMEWVGRGVRVNSLSPGYTETPMNTRAEMTSQMEQFRLQTPMKRMAKVSEMVGPTVFLASKASSYCTGINLVVDGGFTCW